MDLTKYYPDIAAKYPAYVTQRELCEICHICPKTAYNLEQQGEIPYTIEQNHLILAFPSPTYLDPRRRQLQLLNALLGGGCSSRLFQELRETVIVVREGL